MESGGSTPELSQNLVTQLVNYIFVDDMEKVRSFMKNSLRSEQKRDQGVSVLWGTFCTHGVMQDCMSYNIQYYPSITSEYAKFPVLNNGNGSGSESSENNEIETKFRIKGVNRRKDGEEYAREAI